MLRVIKLSKNAAKVEVDGQKGKVITILSKLGADKNPVEFEKLKKACKGVDAKSLRARVRQLAEDRLLSVKRMAAA